MRGRQVGEPEFEDARRKPEQLAVRCRVAVVNQRAKTAARDRPRQGGACGNLRQGHARGIGAESPDHAQAAGLEENLACALCYALGLLTGVLFLVLAPHNQNRLIRFHAFQSIFLAISWIVVYIGISIVSIILLPIPLLGAILSLLLHMGAFLGIFILWLMLMYKAYNKERWVLPIIGPLAEKQA